MTARISCNPQCSATHGEDCTLQVFCCEVDGIFSTLLNDDELLAQLFALLDHVRPDIFTTIMFAHCVCSLTGSMVATPA